MIEIPSDKELRAKAGELDFYDNPDGASAFIESLLVMIDALRGRRSAMSNPAGRSICDLFRPKQWELVEEDKRMISKDVFFGTERPIVCDVYRQKGKDGIYKYKYVPRY